MPGADPVKINTARRARRWRRVEQARAIFENSTRDVAKAMVQKAKAGDVKAARFVLEHTEVTNDEGATLRPVAPSVDRPAPNSQGTGDTGPRIFIGVSLGQDFARLNTDQTDRPQLPPAVLSLPVSQGK